MFINLAHPTYIEHLAAVLHQSKNLLDYFRSEFGKQKSTPTTSPSPSASSSRSNYLPPPGYRKWRLLSLVPGLPAPQKPDAENPYLSGDAKVYFSSATTAEDFQGHRGRGDSLIKLPIDFNSLFD